MADRRAAPVEGIAGFRVLFAKNPLPMWVYDLDTLRFLEVNGAAVAQYGYSRDEFLAMRIVDIRPSEDVPHLLADVARPRAQLQHSDGWRHRRKDGQIIDVSIVSHTLDFDGHRAALVVAQDITRPKRAEEQVRHQFSQLAALRAIDTAIMASLDLRVTLNVLLDQVVSQLQVDAADVLLFNLHTDRLEFAAGRGFRTTVLTQTRLHLGEGYAGRAALERRTVAVPDLTQAPGDFIGSADEGFVAYYAVPLIAKGQVNGVLELFLRRLPAPDQSWLDFLDALAGQAAIAIDNATLFAELQRSNAELRLAYDMTIEGWSRLLDLRDNETEGHTQRVTELTLRLAQAIGVPEAHLVHIRRGALLHDIGKMGVPDSILHKPGPLTDAEWEVMRRHPAHAYELLAPIEYLRPALDIPYCHHEKWDGTGYPRGLGGEQIPLAARIFAVVDVWDALRSDRAYRPAWSDERVRAHLREQSGRQFDPQVVDAFLRLLA